MPPFINSDSSVSSSTSTMDFPYSPVRASNKRRVRFNIDENKVNLIVHVNNMPLADIANTWYDRVEFEAMKEDMVVVIKQMMRRTHEVEGDESTIRGLEFRTKQGSAARQKRKVAAVHAVLDEQDRQYECGTIDDFLLANVYRRHSTPCAQAAIEVGKADEEAIANYASEDISSSCVNDSTKSQEDIEVITFRRKSSLKSIGKHLHTLKSRINSQVLPFDVLQPPVVRSLASHAA